MAVFLRWWENICPAEESIIESHFNDFITNTWYNVAKHY
jgi:hypothetical protein